MGRTVTTDAPPTPATAEPGRPRENAWSPDDQPEQADEADLDRQLTVGRPARSPPFRNFLGCSDSGFAVDMDCQNPIPIKKTSPNGAWIEGRALWKTAEDCEPRAGMSGTPRRGSSGRPVIHRAAR